MARILIVDDDPDVVEACTLVLRSAGHEVHTAFNRDEGMRAAARVRPDLLVLDIIMEAPDDGLVMTQELRRAGFDAPIVLLTSLPGVTGHEYGVDKELVPADLFLEKPVDGATLVGTVESLLAGRRTPSCS